MKTVRDLAPILEEYDEDQHYLGMQIKPSLNDSEYDDSASRGSLPYRANTSNFGNISQFQAEEGHTSSKRLLEV